MHDDHLCFLHELQDFCTDSCEAVVGTRGCSTSKLVISHRTPAPGRPIHLFVLWQLHVSVYNQIAINITQSNMEYSFLL